MSAALRALLDSVIDYAGLFPPARLDMSASLREYAKHLRGPEAWMVSRFVCPATRLAELGEHLAHAGLRDDNLPIGITVIGTRVGDAADFKKSVGIDAEVMQAFADEHSDTAEIEAYEIYKPLSLATADAVRCLKAFAAIDVFLEVGWDDDQTAALHEIVDQDWLGAKARTGGLEAKDFPTAEQLSGFLHEAMSLDLRFKLTAGMHHPLRHHDPIVGADQHGFLNVAVALALIEENSLTREQVQGVLEDRDPANFVFGMDSFTYRDVEVGLPAIDDMRTLYLSYGCCSVADPILGLAKLGLVEVSKS